MSLLLPIWIDLSLLSLVRLQPVAVSRLLGAVPTYRHAAPSPRVATRMIGEEQGASRPFASFYLREILRADEARQRFADRQKQGLWRTPPANALERERGWFAVILPCDPAERFLAFQETVQRLQFPDVLCL